MSPLDIIGIPGYPGLYARRIVVEMWQRAGSPHINDAGRLYATQKAARLAFLNGTGSPADDPDQPNRFPLAHVRFAALDVVPSAQAAMEAAGFEYPYDFELWHAQLPNIYAYPLVTAIPASAGSTPFEASQPQDDIQEEDMALGYYAVGDKSTTVFWIDQATGKRRQISRGELGAAQAFNQATGGKFGTGYVAKLSQSDLDAIPYAT